MTIQAPDQRPNDCRPAAKGLSKWTVLITESSGLAGERLLPRLVEAGFACRVLLRAGKGLL